jgi:hypothetical protein
VITPAVRDQFTAVLALRVRAAAPTAGPAAALEQATASAVREIQDRFGDVDVAALRLVAQEWRAAPLGEAHRALANLVLAGIVDRLDVSETVLLGRLHEGFIAAKKAAKPGPPIPAPPASHGLRDPAVAARFVDALDGLRAEWPRMSPEDRAGRIVATVNEVLAQVGVPPTVHEVADLAPTSGVFSASNWSIQLDAGLVSADTLSDAGLAKIAVVVFHEARHAEQAWLIARLRARGSSDPIGLAHGMDLHLGVAKRAANQPLEAEHPQERDIGAWEHSLYGAGAQARTELLTKQQHLVDRVARGDKSGSTLEVLAVLASVGAYKDLPEEVDARGAARLVRRELGRRAGGLTFLRSLLG